MTNVHAQTLRQIANFMPEAEGMRLAIVNTLNEAADELDRLDLTCPDCGLNMTFAYSKCEVTGKYHEGKPHVVQHVPIDGPVFTIDDPDLDKLLNETHWESVGASQGIGTVEGGIMWLEALEKVQARLGKPIAPWSNMIALYKRIEDWMQSDCSEETSKVLRRLTEYFPPDPPATGPSEQAAPRVVRSVREIEEGSFIYPVKVIVAYTLAGPYSNVALNKDDLLRYVASGLDASPTAEVSLIEEYREGANHGT